MTAGGFWTRFLVPGAVWLFLLFLIPLSLVLALSFGYVDDLGRAVYAFEWDNYKNAFDSTYLPVLLRSVLYAFATTALCLAIGYPVAYYIARYGGKWRNALIALLVLPFFVNYLGPDLRLGRPARGRGPGEQRDRRPRHPGHGHPDDQHAVGGDRRAHLRLPHLHDPARVRVAGAPGQVGDRGRQGPLRDARCGRSSTSPCRRPSRASWPDRCSCSCRPSATSSRPSSSAARARTWSAT